MEETKINNIGNLFPSGHSAGRVIATDGISPTVMENHGTVTAILEDTNKTICLNSKVDGKQPSLEHRIYDCCGVSTAVTTGFHPSIAEPQIAALRGRNPDNPNERGKSNGHYRQRLEINKNKTSNTLTSVEKDNLVVEPKIIDDIYTNRDAREYQDYSPTLRSERSGLKVQEAERLRIPQATKQGYVELEQGGVFDGSYPNSKTRRGRVQEGGKITPTLTANGEALNFYERPQFRIRKLTPRECFRLMDVKESDIDKIQSAGISNSQQYKLAGNSIVVSCLYHIFRKMLVEPYEIYEQEQLKLF